jgi:ubiquinone/menaquinone biosynthesis C-methylase UbiE
VTFLSACMIKLNQIQSGAVRLSLIIYIELPAEITVSDINPNMLDVGKRRAVERGIFHDLKFLVANAENLETLKSDDFDLYTIAFGIRNVTDRPKALREAYRILRRGGRFMCLEFSEV